MLFLLNNRLIYQYSLKRSVQQVTAFRSLGLCLEVLTSDSKDNTKLGGGKTPVG